jgi:hypothetical protein
MSLASRLLLLSRWSRETGLGLVVASGSAGKRASLRRRDTQAAIPAEAESWVADGDPSPD